MLALNRRFRPREALAGIPLWSLVSVVLSFFFGYTAITYEYWPVRYLAVAAAISVLVFGVTLFVFKDWAMFTDSVFANFEDKKASLAGSEDQ